VSNWSLDFALMVPPPVYWVGLALAVVLVVLLILRRMRGALLRALSLAALLLALANPTLRQEERESLANIAIVVIDESLSQTIAGRPEQTAAIKRELEARLGEIPNLQVRWVSSSKPNGQQAAGTTLFADLNSALANTPPDRLAGVIMITDGQVHDVPKSAQALGFDAPVHALLTGTPGEFDRRIEIIKAPRYGIVGSTREIELKVVETGRKGRAGDRVTLKIRREGSPDTTRVAIIGKTVTVPMSFPHAGQNLMEIELETAPGELTAANNRVVVVAEGVRENLRVLLVSGEPHTGERVWRNLLKSDAAVDLVHFTILRPPTKNDGTPTSQLSLIQFPTRELFGEKIKEFDLIIFDRYQHRDILQTVYYENIARYVQEGGALLVASGDDYAGKASLAYTALSSVLPAMPTGQLIERPYKAKLTGDGVKHPVTRGLPGADEKDPHWGRWFRQVEVSPGRGHVLMQGADDRPLLVLDRKGKGRVALLLSDHAWLWARGFEGGGPHTDLLRRLSHWLMKEPDLEEERLLASAKGLKLTIERRSMEEEAVDRVQVSAPGGEKSEVMLEKAEPGVWRATVDVAVPGLYKLQTSSSLGPLTAVAFAGVEDAREMSEVTATDEKLRPIADQTGGGVFWTRGGGLLASTTSGVDLPRISMLANARVLAGSGWMGLKDREAFVTRGVKLIPMFTGFLALSALLALLAATWWREGR
jgi:putative glutamine amidotransferase